MFGPESVGLPAEVQRDEHITERVKIPMKPGRRSSIWLTPHRLPCLRPGARTTVEEAPSSMATANTTICPSTWFSRFWFYPSLAEQIRRDPENKEYTEQG